MTYLSAKDFSILHGINIRTVQLYCKNGSIDGVLHTGREWLIPENALLPSRRRKAAAAVDTQTAYAACGLISTVVPFGEQPKLTGIPMRFQKDALLEQNAELAYFQGDFEQAKRSFYDIDNSSPYKICACINAMGAAISTGDYAFFTEIEIFLNRLKNTSDKRTSLLCEMALATVAVSIFVPVMAPVWLKNGDFSAFPSESYSFLLYLYVKYLQNIGEYYAMLAVARTALLTCAEDGGVTTFKIYMKLMCAAASMMLSNNEQARKYLFSALSMGLPLGITTPFAENTTALGGLMETTLKQHWQQYYKQITSGWLNTKNWLYFHNQFAKNNITLILTLQEYQVAQLLCSGSSYAATAKSLGVSIGRINNIVSCIYEKLFISSKVQLRQYIL